MSRLPNRPEGGWTPETLTSAFPEVEWREPLPVTIVGVEGRTFVCRTCVANDGLKAVDVTAALRHDRSDAPAFASREDFDEHMRTQHQHDETEE